VQNALTAQFGVSAFYRTKFYADAYNPAIGQFYLQRDKLIGNYPLVDVFVNLKWKKAIIFLKYEHVNQGVPNNEYFATYRYPMNPRVFKFGISWMFYD
jgi:outer membrane receptor protein involved in Fe transport